MRHAFADDGMLKRLSLVCSVAGLVVIYIASLCVQPATVDIKQITAEMTGRTVHFSGVIASVRASNGNVFMTVEDGTGSITAVAFSPLPSAMKMPKRGSSVGLTGTVDSYRGSLEVVLRSPKDVVVA